MAQKFKIGDEVIALPMPRSYDQPLEAGKKYKISHIEAGGPGEDWIRVGSELGYEAKYFKLAAMSSPIAFEMCIKEGYVYKVECSDEAMKELADIVGDDHLASIRPIKTPATKKEKKSAKSEEVPF